MEVSIEQCCAIRFCFRLGNIGAETHEMIKKAYKDEAMSRAQVFKGHKLFKEGCTSFENELCFGWLSTERSDENVQKNYQLVHLKRLDLSYGNVNQILTDNWQLAPSPGKCTCAHCPHCE
ncbi:protein GVQW3-like [Homarus americanus]|uniref:protein GVQW3-like n=1 Tax=Homarus americanus TaxID=6706 RepID=UPI001C448078|nr:protein GVQW3-like [Homarus americanus]